MIKIKIVNIDVRDAGQNSDAAEKFVNNELMNLQQAGCMIIGSPTLFHVDTGKMIYNITYDDPRTDEKNDE